MKAVILCGGKGERLREETEFKPKPLIEIGSMPILWHIMKIYSTYGVRDFVLLLGYKGHMIKEFFLNFEFMTNDSTLNLRDKDNKIMFHKQEGLEDWNITFLDTGGETSTGGRIARAQEHLKGEDFFLTYGDGVADINMNDLASFHKKMGRTLTLTGINPTSQYGIIEVKDGIAVSFKEKPRLDGFINGGFFVCKPDIFKYLDPDEKCVFEEDPMRNMARDKQLAVYTHSGFWAAVDTYKQVQGLNKIWNTSETPPWKIWK